MLTSNATTVEDSIGVSTFDTLELFSVSVVLRPVDSIATLLVHDLQPTVGGIHAGHVVNVHPQAFC
jgi:hypothetical protein